MNSFFCSAPKSFKQKVEMFEKIQSPVPQRQTRTKTRAKQSSADAETTSSTTKTNPLLTKGLTSAAIDQHNKHQRTQSATRIGGTKIQTPTLTKSQSVEEIRKKTQVSFVLGGGVWVTRECANGLTFLQILADEKKKIREEKARAAKEQREAIDKAKSEKARKLAEVSDHFESITRKIPILI